MTHDVPRPLADDDGILERGAPGREAAGQGPGRPALRFTRQLAHPPAKVWRALTEPGHLAAWFPTTIDGDRSAGAKLSFTFPDLAVPPMDGEMLAADWPSLLEFRWGTETLRFELSPAGDGTALTFTVSLDELGKAARDGAGWHSCLDLLACELSGQAPSWGPGERWRQVHPGYVRRFGPDACTIGPPQEWIDAHDPAGGATG
jgi:uncharacterized protein YndB with AHSA1/START domain